MIPTTPELRLWTK